MTKRETTCWVERNKLSIISLLVFINSKKNYRHFESHEAFKICLQKVQMANE